MSVLNSESFQEGIPKQLLLFDTKITQTAVQDAYFAEIRPLSQISNEVCEFRIASSNSLDYIDMHGSQLYVKLKVTKREQSRRIIKSRTSEFIFTVIVFHCRSDPPEQTNIDMYG